MIVKGIGVVFFKKKGIYAHIYRQGITRYSGEDGCIEYYDIDGDRFRIVSCMYPANDSPEDFYVQGEDYKLDRNKMNMSLPRLRSVFNALIFSPDACNMHHAITVL